MNWLNKRLGEVRGKSEQMISTGLVDPEGKVITKTTPASGVNPQELYSIRKDINAVLGGKYQGEASNLRLASGQLIKVRLRTNPHLR